MPKKLKTFSLKLHKGAGILKKLKNFLNKGNVKCAKYNKFTNLFSQNDNAFEK